MNFTSSKGPKRQEQCSQKRWQILGSLPHQNQISKIFVLSLPNAKDSAKSYIIHIYVYVYDDSLIYKLGMVKG